MTQDDYRYALQSCVWEITLACSFSCKYCGSKAGAARRNELTTEECLSVAKQLADMGCRRVSLIGGEVFLRKDWAVIAKTLTERNVKVPIITNGFLLSENLIRLIRETGIESVAVSLDGPPEIHDSFRQQGSFARAMQAIRVLTENDIPVSVISTLHSGNVSHLEEMYGILSQTGIFAWQLQACSPMGNAVDSAVSTGIDFETVIRFVERHLSESPISVCIADNIGYYVGNEGDLRGSPDRNAVFYGCSAGLSGIGIDSVGNVRGCESMYDDRFIEGNLREKSLREIWNDPNAFAYNRQFTVDMLQGKCRECEHGSKCAGGCRSYNYFSSGKLYESLRCARRGAPNQ